MKCDELKLFLFLEGKCSKKEDGEIRDHLSHCNRCQLKYERMKFTVDCFTSYYRDEQRAACPSAEEIVHYQEGELKSSSSKEVGEHISRCPICKAEFLLLEESDVEDELSRGSIPDPPVLNRGVLDGIAKLRRKSLKDKMEHVLRTLVDKGKEALTPQKIDEVLEKYLLPYQEPLPAHAMPSATAKFDTGLELNESAVCDISLDIGGYSLAIKAVDGLLSVRVTIQGAGVSGVEVTFMTENLGARRAVTGSDGTCVIAGIRQGPYQISIKVHDDSEK